MGLPPTQLTSTHPLILFAIHPPQISVELHFGKFSLSTGDFAVEDGEQIRCRLSPGSKQGQRWGQEMRFPKIESGEVPNVVVCLKIERRTVAFCHIAATALFDAKFDYTPQWYPLQRDPSCPPQLANPKLPLSEEIYAGSMLLAVGLGYASDGGGGGTGMELGIEPRASNASNSAVEGGSVAQAETFTHDTLDSTATSSGAVGDEGDGIVQQLWQKNARKLSWQSLTGEQRQLWQKVRPYPTQRWELRVHVYQARGLPAKDTNGLSDPYVSVMFGGKTDQKTDVKRKTLSPSYFQVRATSAT
jgi:hypothetical protein